MDRNDIRLFLLGIIALIRVYKLTAGSGKRLEENFHVYIVRLKQTIKAFAIDFECLSIGFNRNHERRQQELIKNETVKGKYHVRIMLLNFFLFCAIATVLEICFRIYNKTEKKQ